jgi:hypothetical protein
MCGVGYKPKAVLAAEAITASPEKSDRAIADEIGVGKDTVRRARVAHDAPVESRTGKDGRTRRLPEPADPELVELRERADALGCVIRKRGSSGYSITNRDGIETGAPNLDHLTRLLAIAEGEAAERGQSGAADGEASAETRKAENATTDEKIALDEFDAHVHRLLQITKGQKPQRFSKTAVALPLIGDLARFLRELVAVRKLAAGTAEDDLSIPPFLDRTDGTAS